MPSRILIRKADNIKLRSLARKRFVEKVATEGIDLMFVDSDSDHSLHRAFGTDFRTLYSDYRGSWVSIVAKERSTKQIVFGTSLFVWRHWDHVAFWERKGDTPVFRQKRKQDCSWSGKENVIYAGFTACSHSGAVEIVETSEVVRINENLRLGMAVYIAAFKDLLVDLANAFDAALMIEPQGDIPIPHTFTYSPEINVGDPAALERIGTTRRASMVTEYLCSRTLKLPLRPDVYGLHSLGKVFYGRIRH